MAEERVLKTCWRASKTPLPVQEPQQVQHRTGWDGEQIYCYYQLYEMTIPNGWCENIDVALEALEEGHVERSYDEDYEKRLAALEQREAALKDAESKQKEHANKLEQDKRGVEQDRQRVDQDRQRVDQDQATAKSNLADAQKKLNEAVDRENKAKDLAKKAGVLPPDGS